MKKVYVVVSGHYSDYHIEGIFESKENAEKVCACNNNASYMGYDNKRYYDNDFRIEEYEFADESYGFSKTVKPMYVYEIRISLLNGELRISEISIFSESEFDNVRKYWIDNPSSAIIVFLRERDDERALKIAADRLAEKKAVDEGIL